MADKDENLPKRIEAVFARMGLGNLDPEKLNEYLETYENTMAAAVKTKKKDNQDFDEVLSVTPPSEPEEPS